MGRRSGGQMPWCLVPTEKSTKQSQVKTLCRCPRPLKTLTAEPFVLLTGGEAATSSLITSPQTWGSLINPSEGMIYRFQLRSLMDWPSSAEAETLTGGGVLPLPSPFPPAADPQRGRVALVGFLAPLRPGLRPGPVLHGWLLLTFQAGKTETFDNIWCCGGTGHSPVLLAEAGVSTCVCTCVCTICSHGWLSLSTLEPD